MRGLSKKGRVTVGKIALLRLGMALTTLLAGSVAAQVGGAAAAPGADFATRAREKVAQAQGIAIDKLSVVGQADSRLAYSHKNLADYKVRDTSGRVFQVSFDQATGEPADPATATRDEARARQAALGKQDASLHDRFAQAPDKAQPVALWVAMADPGQLGRTPGGLDKLRAMVRAVEEPVAAAVRAAGGTPKLADAVPVVFADLDAGQAGQLEARADVSNLDFAGGVGKVMIDDSATSNHYPYAWPVANGGGTIVAVHEDDGVDNVNPFLNNGTHAVTYWDPGRPDINLEGGHATHVAGVLASSNPWRRGGAFAAGKILSANFHNFLDNAALVNSATWAAGQGANVINMSWGFCTSGLQDFHSRWVDFASKAFATNFVVSSGNRPNCGGSLFVAAPSLGWNTLSVGSYWDHDTGLRGDDTESSFTEFRNPTDPNSGRTVEKPDVTAMGGEGTSSSCFGVETTGVGGGVGKSTCGTSFSAPDTAALAADVTQAIGAGRPEAVKAIVMAGATHNIVDGASYLICSTSPFPGDCQDGAGAIDAGQAINNVAAPGNWAFDFLTDASFPSSSHLDRAATLTAGVPARAVLAWDSTATCANPGGGNCAGDVLNADIDLHVIDPNGNLVTGAFSFQNSAEVVDFTPTVSGTYTIRAFSFRFDAGSSTFLGMAWNPDTRDLVNPLTGATPVALNTTLTGQTTDQGHSFWDSYPGTDPFCGAFLAPETGLEKVYQITTSETGDISAVMTGITAASGAFGDIDVILLRAAGPPEAANGQVVTCGDTALTALDQPAGTYYVVVDGYLGSVGSYNLGVGFTSGAAAPAATGPPPARR
jgi:hypothetical protein